MQKKIAALLIALVLAGCHTGDHYPPTPTPETTEAWQLALAPRHWWSGIQELEVEFDSNGQIHIRRDGPHMDERFIEKMGGIREVTREAFACLGGEGDAAWYVDQLDDGSFVLCLTRSGETLQYRMTWESYQGPLEGLILDGDGCHLNLDSAKRR